jgi:hypothetical protein
MCRGLQVNSLAAYATEDFAEHSYSVSGDNPPDIALLTDDNLAAGYVASEFAVNTEFAATDKFYTLPRYLEAVVEYRS